MKLFPHSMIRIGGGPFNKLETLNVKESTALIDTIYALKEKLNTLKQTISDELYDLIPKLTDPAAQNILVKTRRDIFNRRNISPEKLKKITPHLPETIITDIETYRQTKEEINRLWNKGETLFTEEVSAARKQFKTMALDHNLRKGLLLGSQSLYKRLPTYIGKESKMKKKDFQTERGLTKYFSRMHGKTSPFSTFTNLAMGAVTPDPPPPLPEHRVSPLLRLKDHKKAEVVYHIRLNNLLYNYLKTLLTKNPNIYRYLLLRPNPTIQKNEDHYLYLTNSNNIEAFQRIPANPALEVFLILSTQQKEGIVYREMVQTIIDNEYIDAPAETLEDFINQLIDYGFLEFDFGVSGIDPDWDKKLVKKLIHLEKELPLIRELLETLTNLRNLADQYGESDCQNRTRLIEEAFEQFKTVCMKLHEDAGLPEEERLPQEELKKIREEKQKEAEAAQKDERKEEETKEEDQPFKQISSTFFNFTPEKMFYEDTSLDIQPQLDETHILEFTRTLHNLLQKMRHYEGQFDEWKKMLHYFVNKYGENASVDLLTFYEDYYREYKKPEAQKEEAQKREAQKKESPEEKKEKDDSPELPELPTIQVIEERKKKQSQWLEHIKTRLKKSLGENGLDTDKTVNIYLRDLEETEKMIPGEIDHTERDCSYGCFVQFFTERDPDGKETLKGVSNATFPGFGKMFSRFLHIFDDTVTEDMRAWNRSLLTENRIFLEDSDASFFNANLHPPLLPHEIHMPNGQNTLPPEQQIPITELKVKVDDTGGRLQLLHEPTKKRVYVFDLGFQGHKGRSQLFQLLEKFTKAEYLFAQPLVNAVNSLRSPSGRPGGSDTEKKEPEKKEPKINVLPRVVYEDRIVLQRKSWFVPEELLPLREPGETDWAWFYRVNEWRKQQGMPDDVFIFVVDRFGGANREPKPNKRVSPDDYKPQYISFKNPFLINLLEKAMNRVPGTLKIAEMMPNPSQLPNIGDNRYVMEFVLQWYTQKARDEQGKEEGREDEGRGTKG